MNLRTNVMFVFAIALPFGCATTHSDDHAGFEEGFESVPVQVALVGPVDADKPAYQRIKDLESNESLATPEGAHEAPWTLPGTLGPIEMMPDRFFDGAIFDPAIAAKAE